MNIIQKLTLRHLKENKRRTLVTIIGTVISVAMITAVATLAVSFIDLLQRQSIADHGEWHVQYLDINPQQLEKIKLDDNIKEIILSRDLGYALLEGSENQSKPYLFIKQYDRSGFSNFPITLGEGRLPVNEREIVISEEIANNAKVTFDIGQEITLAVGERKSISTSAERMNQTYSLTRVNGEMDEKLKNLTNETYTIVGTIKRPNWEPYSAPGYTVITFLDENAIQSDESINASIILKKVNRDIYSNAEQLAKESDISLESIRYNNSLLRYYGVISNDGVRSTVFSLSAIIIAVIIIGSVALIYNAFAISVSERSRQLGMLSSVGATKHQKRNSVFFEGAVIGAISIPLGILAGVVGIGITFYFINSFLAEALGTSEKLRVTVTPSSILFTCFISIITIFISTYLPARKASRISAIDAIRQTTDVMLTKKTVKTSKLVRMIFGIEAEIGLKNLKRNKRKYRVTVFSLVVSIVLFLTVSFFTFSLEKAAGLSSGRGDFDIQIYIGEDLSGEQLQTLEAMTALEGVTDYLRVRELQFATWIDESKINDVLKEYVLNNKGILDDGKFRYHANVQALDADNLRAYTNEIGVDYDKLTSSDKVTGILIDTLTYTDYDKGKTIETKSMQANIGEKIELYHENGEYNETTFINEIEVIGFTNQLPSGEHLINISDLILVVSEDAVNKLIRKDLTPYYYNYLFLKSTNPLETQYQLEEMDTRGMHIFNYHQARQSDQQVLLLLSVFVYGFIVLITAISLANILNTISTSISLRKREFAMLKSVGMTPKSFTKMINYESIFYGIKSLLYGLPISIGIMYLMYRSMMHSFTYRFELPWTNIIIVVVAVFLIVGSAMLYSTSKVRKENIIETLKQENI
ncbi:MAG: ABC transporter permease [Anaerobacillus sp.]|uniref:ABC transporter permease n=1 Tax=Anaerobacillus sp. TaxID=1872506 RepID=UPI00391D98A8